MKTHVLAIFAVLLAANTTASQAGEKPSSAAVVDVAAANDGKFESLVGDSLEQGWEGSLGDWRIEDGVLIGTADGTLKANRFIISKADNVGDFELNVEVWVSDQGNSGIQYRSELREDLGPHRMVGYQCDVVALVPKYNGMLYEEMGRRILCHTGEKVITDTDGQGWVVRSQTPPEFQSEQWHRYRIRVVGNHHEHWIDDIQTINYIDLDKTGRKLGGKIGVQVHVGPPMEVRYRNFRLQRLPSVAPIDSSSPEATIPASAVKIVPQGGWKKGKH